MKTCFNNQQNKVMNKHLSKNVENKTIASTSKNKSNKPKNINVEIITKKTKTKQKR